MSMTNVKQWYWRRLLSCASFTLGTFDEQLGVFHLSHMPNLKQHQGLRVLAFLFATRLTGNPYYRDESVLRKIIRQGDVICGATTAGPAYMGVEWIPYGVMECIEFLGDDLKECRRCSWIDAIDRHLAEMAQINNYIATAPNHFMWRGVLLYRCGQLFGREEWCRAGQFLIRQLCKMQMPDGYWDEAHRGHGPSPGYHRVLLHALDLYYRFSEDQAVRPALELAIDFAIRAAYPDGTPIETMEGRLTYLPAFDVAAGAQALSRVPGGRRLLELQVARLDALGVCDTDQPCGFSACQDVTGAGEFLLDGYRYMEDGTQESLPQEGASYCDWFALGGHGGAGSALVSRIAPWFISVCAAESDVPRMTPNIYITERQNGISLYHDAVGLVLGGGNRLRNHVAFANAVVVTGWKGVDCHGGVFPDSAVKDHGLPGGNTEEGRDPVKSTYHPIRREAKTSERGATLWLDFLHASIELRLDALGPDELAIDYHFESAGATKILLQVPIPVFRGDRLCADDVGVLPADMEDVRTVPVRRRVSRVTSELALHYELPEDTDAFLTYPLEPIRYAPHGRWNHTPDARFMPLYAVGLLSREFCSQDQSGRLLTVRLSRG